MTNKIELQAEKREELGTKPSKNLRSAGFIPAVIYGKGFDPVPLKVDYKKFKEAYKEAGSSTMIQLKLGDESHPAIIQDVTIEPVSSDYTHADFYKVRLDQKITARVHLNFIGESPAVKDLDGVFTRNINEIEVEALPQDLPPQIDVDTSSLTELGQSILIKDLNIGEGVEVTAEPDEIVATVVAPREEEEEEVEETSIEDVEVIEKKGEEEEGDEAEEAPKEESAE